MVNFKGMCTLGFHDVAVGRINGVAALRGFSYKKMYGRFAGPQNRGRNNEVTALTRRPYVRRGSTV